jgi:hypothetical protein
MRFSSMLGATMVAGAAPAGARTREDARVRPEGRPSRARRLRAATGRRPRPRAGAAVRAR